MLELAVSVDQPQVAGKRLSFFERYLTLWVALCMVIGVLIGQAIPGLVSSLRGAEIGQGSHINLPIAVLIWLMIVPMMMKVEFASVRDVGKRPVRLLMSGASSLAVPFDVLLYSVAIFIVIPLIVGAGLRLWLVRRYGLRWMEEQLLPRFAPVTIVALLLTLVCIFAFQSQHILGKTAHVVLIAVPIMLSVCTVCNHTRHWFNQEVSA